LSKGRKRKSTGTYSQEDWHERQVRREVVRRNPQATPREDPKRGTPNGLLVSRSGVAAVGRVGKVLPMLYRLCPAAFDSCPVGTTLLRFRLWSGFFPSRLWCQNFFPISFVWDSILADPHVDPALRFCVFSPRGGSVFTILREYFHPPDLVVTTGLAWLRLCSLCSGSDAPSLRAISPPPCGPATSPSLTF